MLRELSGFRSINRREFRRLVRLGYVELERTGREVFLHQRLLTGNPVMDDYLLEALRLLAEERARHLPGRGRLGGGSGVAAATEKGRSVGLA